MNRDKSRIAVVGSSNMDLVVRTPRIPVVGETILGGDFIMVPGGKGANQAVAAAKLQTEVYFIAKLGDDVFAAQSLSNFRQAGVNTEYVAQTKEAPSGIALITVDDMGENAIVVAPGANQKLRPEDIRLAESAIGSCGAVVAQLEIPLETVQFAADLAHRQGVRFILDPAPAPAEKLPPELLAKVDVLTPNETEAKTLTDIEVADETSGRRACKALLDFGVRAVILTLGAKGFLLATNEKNEFVGGINVNTIDSTAAGDAFTGSLACGMARGKSLFEAAVFANYVAALSVTKRGAQSSMPTKEEVENFINQNR